MTVQLPDMPESIAALPRDVRGYPVPWFVAWMDGVPEFRAMDQRKWFVAVQEKRCWVCGTPLNPRKNVFVIGPMSTITHTAPEPPCHEGCAVFSVKACPFLSKPKAIRREANLPDDACEPAGLSIDRNPGVTCLWYCTGYELFPDGQGGQLLSIPNPSGVRWFREGRNATRAEIMESIESGLPILRHVAMMDGKRAERELEWAITRAMKFIPAA